MKPDQLQFEESVLDMARQMAARLAPELAEAGLTAEVQGLHRWSGPAYVSELTILLKRGTNLVDVIECLVYRDGRQAATLAEIEDWIGATIRSSLRDER